jgi:DUF4097 and DUF4098 domain-containing protein YvlB
MKLVLKFGVLFVILGMIGAATFLFLSGNDRDALLEEEVLKYESTRFTKLYLSVEDERIVVKPSVTNELIVTIIYEDYETLTVKELENELNIDVRASFLTRFTRGIQVFNLARMMNPKEVIIELPEAIEEVFLKTSNGKISVSGANLQQGSFVTSNGKIEIQESTITDLGADTSNGDISLEDVTATKASLDTSNGTIQLQTIIIDEIDAETSNGRITGSKITTNRLKAHSSNGSINLNVYGQFMDYKVKTKTSNGTVRINDAVYGSSTYNQSQLPYIETVTSNGSINLSFYGD